MMKQLSFSIVLFLHLGVFSQTPELIFHSGFEPDVDTFGQNANDVDIVGIDNSVSVPNDWVNDLENHPNIGYFKIQFQGGTMDDRMAEIVPDPINPLNNALQFWVLNPNSGNNGRVQANLYGNNGIYNLYYSFRMYLPGDFNLLKNAPFDTEFFTVMEFWNNANWDMEDYMFRISVNITKNGDDPDSLRIKAAGQIRDLVLNKWGERIWEFINPTYVVPVQKWMTLKVYFVEGNDCTGRFIITIQPDGEAESTVLDIRNFTHHPDDPNPDGLSDLNPFKLYCDDDIVNYVTGNGGLLNVFWDDFELWKDPDIDIDDSCLPGGITFSSQSQIDNFATNYPGCHNISGDVFIESGGTQINNLDGLSQLTSIQGSLKIESNTSLTDLSGLENLTCVNGYLKIESNSALTDISALSNLRSLAGYLKIDSNNSLSNLSGLENITAINGDLTIANNAVLTSLTGLESIKISTFTNLVIQNNPNLSFCELENICKYLENAGPAIISGNAPGCSTKAEVEAACLLLLPVELIHFSGKETGGYVLLSWQTVSEVSNDYFLLEHSTNGIDFSQIGKINGNGTTLEEHNYVFIHKQPSAGLNYYRLKQVDFNGGYEYSDVIAIVVENDGITIRPNPTNGFVEIIGENFEGTILKITDSMGRVVETTQLANSLSIDLSNQPNGIYFFIIQAPGQTVVKRIVKS